jgi:addiction module RelE/StbE family toxin
MTYKITYLPVALKDLEEIIDYITINLKSPDAALDFITAFDESVSILELFPYSRRVYQPIKNLEYEYRLLPVKNYAVFYSVKEQTVEIHRVIYGKKNLSELIAHNPSEDS